MPSARRKRAQNKYYIQNIKDLKAKARSNYSADPEKKKAASKANYSGTVLTPSKRRLLLKRSLKLATVLTLRKRRLPLKLATMLAYLAGPQGTCDTC